MREAPGTSILHVAMLQWKRRIIGRVFSIVICPPDALTQIGNPIARTLFKSMMKPLSRSFPAHYDLERDIAHSSTRALIQSDSERDLPGSDFWVPPGKHFEKFPSSKALSNDETAVTVIPSSLRFGTRYCTQLE